MTSSVRRFAGASLGLLLLASATAAGAELVREPYLQSGTPTSMTLVWRTAAASDSRVRYGTSAGSLDTVVTDDAVVTDHVVTLTGLTPDTKYFYDVGSLAAVEAGGDADHFFVTAPAPATQRPFTAWVVGDSGTGGAAQAAVRDAMLAHVGATLPDIMLHVGDMAYEDGLDQEFTDHYFSVYADVLRNTVAWPAIGNHEARTSESPGQTGPYYQSYVLPSGGEAGGVASGTEAYYAFDYANVHFVVLDSADSDLAVDGAMASWLFDDLAATEQQWVVAFFHHPPYSKGSHDSDNGTDSGGRLRLMRENLLPVLEAGGVDLVFAGHSHVYERSFLIDQVYCPACGPEPDLVTLPFAELEAAGLIVDSGDGDPGGDGAYVKAAGLNANDGAVYVVAGHGGRSVRSRGIHPVMAFTEVAFGSCLVTFDGATVTLANLREDGVISDTFTLVKGEAAACEVQGDRCLDADAVCKSCGLPQGLDGEPTATDALAVMSAAVGVLVCEPCICDVDASGDTVATDALRVLARAVGQPVALACPQP